MIACTAAPSPTPAPTTTPGFTSSVPPSLAPTPAPPVTPTLPTTAVPAASPTYPAFELQPGDWPQSGRDPAHTGYNDAETALSQDTVAGLRLTWTGTSSGRFLGLSPVVADGVVYVTADGRLYAYAVGCRSDGANCSPLWTAGGDLRSSPIVADGVVYVRSQGKLYAYRAGRYSPEQLWTASLGGDSGWPNPVVADGVVYVTTGYQRNGDAGKLFAFAHDCSNGGGSCSPLWTASTEYGADFWADSSLAVAGGVVYLGTVEGTLYAFAVGCGTGGATCSPLWTWHETAHLASSPVVADGVVYVGVGDDEWPLGGVQKGRLHAFAVGCGVAGTTCAPLWTGATRFGIRSSPAVAEGVVYVRSSYEGEGRLYAFAVDCGRGARICAPIWTAKTSGYGSGSPAVANGVVYVAGGDGMYAFDVDCARRGGTCSPIWTAATGITLGQPALADGVVYVVTTDGTLRAFALEP